MSGKKRDGMLITRIRTHNIVNGFVFSAVEFALMSMVILPFGVYYFLHGRVEAGLVVTGIVANCVTIIAFAVYSMRAGHEDIGVMNWFNKEGRRLIASTYPNLSQDTLVLTVGTLVPFVVMLASLYDLRQEWRAHP
jgi:hypothetical protein